MTFSWHIDPVPRPRGFDKHTLEEIKRDLTKWAAEGDVYAAEALQILESEERT